MLQLKKQSKVMKRIDRIGAAWGLAFVIFTFFNNVNCDECTVEAICKCIASYEPGNATASALLAFGGILQNQTTLDLCNPPKLTTTTAPTTTSKTTPTTTSKTTPKTTSTTAPTTTSKKPNPTYLFEPNNAQLLRAEQTQNNGSLHMVLSCDSVNTSNKTSTPHDIKNGTFVLSLKYQCDAPHPKEHPYSTGSVLVIIFFTCVFAYLGMGIAVRYFMLGARGIEVLPNLDFWKDFPALIRDGARFLQNGCKARPSDLSTASPEGYDAI